MRIQQLPARHLAVVQATLGEGPVWDRRAGALWFVDLEACRIHRFAPATGEISTWPTPAKVGWVFPSRRGGLLVGLADGLYRLAAEGRFERLHAVDAAWPGNRLNDAGLGPDGDVWFGTMDAAETSSSGHFYRFDGQAVYDLRLPPACITNGPAVSPDGRTLYTVDTLARRIDAHRIGRGGELGATAVFATISEADGYPDGVTCDSAGGVWLALWGGGAARRYDASGRQTHEVRFPVANVTKVALGGANRRTAYVTTARRGLDEGALAAQPQAGDLFTFEAPSPGIASREPKGV